MRRVLLLAPLLLTPPLLVAAYFLFVEGHRPWGRPDAPAPAGNLQSAQAAFDRANQFLNQARQSHPGQQTALLTQAVVHYRVCLAYEAVATELGPLFDDARQNLEVSRLLLGQAAKPAPARPAAPAIAQAPPPAVKADAGPKVPHKPEPVPVADARPPARKNQPPKTPRALAVGPDGIVYEIIDTDETAREDSSPPEPPAPPPKPAPTPKPKVQEKKVEAARPPAPVPPPIVKKEQPLRQPETSQPKTTTLTVGPDGIIFETVE